MDEVNSATPRAAILVSINLGVKRQTSEDQTRLILLQISPQEMGSAEDLMFFKAVFICLTAPFEGLTVTVTPGVRGLGRSFGVAAARKRKSASFFFKWSLIYSTVCLGFQFKKETCGSEQRGEAVGSLVHFP